VAFEPWLSLILVRNVVGELQPKRTLAASRGFLAAARLSCFNVIVCLYVTVGNGEGFEGAVTIQTYHYVTSPRNDT